MLQATGMAWSCSKQIRFMTPKRPTREAGDSHRYDAVAALGFSQDGAWLISVSSENEVAVWDVGKEPIESPKRLRLDGHCRAMRMDPYENQAYVVGWVSKGNAPGSELSRADTSAVCLDLPSLAVLWQQPYSHAYGITSLAVDCDGQYLATGGQDGTVQLHPLKGQNGTSRLLHASPPVTLIAAGGTWFAVADRNATWVAIRDRITGKEILRLPELEYNVKSLVPLPKRNQLLTACGPGRLDLWDVKTGKLLAPSPSPMTRTCGTPTSSATAKVVGWRLYQGLASGYSRPLRWK